MFPTSWQRCDKPAMTHDIHTKWRQSQWNKCKTSEPGWIIFHFSTFRFNYRLQISSIFSAAVASSCESLCDKWNYVTLCVSCLYMNKAILSENNRECDTFKHAAASQNLGTYSHKRHISKKNKTPLFIYRWVKFDQTYVKEIRLQHLYTKPAPLRTLENQDNTRKSTKDLPACRLMTLKVNKTHT